MSVQGVYTGGMNMLEAIILGLVQGLTEFIPVSSSGHLVLLHDALGLSAGGLVFDVALHVGTLVALLVYFRRDIVRLLRSLIVKDDDARLAWLLILATIPAAVAGLLLQGAAESAFRSAKLVAINLMVFGGLMLAAEKLAAGYKKKTELDTTRPRQALIMGAAQALAIVPGVSRSGSTITAGLFAGLDRVAATRFSFLLAIPIISGATLKVLADSAARSQLGEQPGLFVAGMAAACLSGLFAIRFLLRFLSKRSLAVFAYYRLALGLIVLWLVW